MEKKENGRQGECTVEEQENIEDEEMREYE